MKDPIGSYYLSLEPIDETEVEDNHPAVEIESKYTNLNERFVALKAITETLKEQIKSEKELWSKELDETIKLGKEIKLRESHHNMVAHGQDDFKKKMEVFKDFIFFYKSNNHIEKAVRENNYKQWLKEVEDECETELNKIKQNLTALKPLQEMASTWTQDRAFPNYGLKYLDSSCGKYVAAEFSGKM